MILVIRREVYLAIETIEREGCVIVRPGFGRLDPANCSLLRDELLPVVERSGAVVLDLRDIHYIVSPALNLILEAHDRIKRRNGRLVLIYVHSPVRRVLHLSGLSAVLTIRDTEVDAVDFLKNMA